MEHLQNRIRVTKIIANEEIIANSMLPQGRIISHGDTNVILAEYF